LGLPRHIRLAASPYPGEHDDDSLSLAAFCEGFTGIEAFAQAWAKYFQLRKQVIQEPPQSKDDPPEMSQEKKDRPMTQCGAATIMSQKGSDFPKVELLESCKKWQKSFFYVKNTTDVDQLNLSPFVDEPPLAMKNWIQPEDHRDAGERPPPG
jgi:hypothetical protein